jgi:hypothetical protein
LRSIGAVRGSSGMTIARRVALVVLVLLLPVGCRWPWEPESVLVRGTIRYVGGARAVAVKVALENGASTFTDWAGRYALVAYNAPGDTIHVVAYELCPEACFGWQAGGATVIVRRSELVVNIVLNERVDI